jgi:thiamine biosynthesis lipoprotein
MGTTYTVKVALPEGRVAWGVTADEIARIVAAVDGRMSTYKADSELSRLNRAPTLGPVPLSSSLHAVLQAAMGVYVASGGVFDVTVGPLVNLWGFGPTGRRRSPPNAKAVAAALAHTGARHLGLGTSQPSLKRGIPGLAIDLSGIAAGYAVDRVAAFLEDQGATDYLVDLGGEMKARGHNAKGLPWRVGIERADAAGHGVEFVVGLTGGVGLATSGDYRNFFVAAGKRYSHIIDPRTGYPVDHGAAAVTVIAPTAMAADAWATALLVLGPKAGLGLAERVGIEASFAVVTGGRTVRQETQRFSRYRRAGAADPVRHLGRQQK